MIAVPAAVHICHFKDGAWDRIEQLIRVAQLGTFLSTVACHSGINRGVICSK
jgi:hypothetical protein